jgi:hypothetical protein
VGWSEVQFFLGNIFLSTYIYIQSFHFCNVRASIDDRNGKSFSFKFLHFFVRTVSYSRFILTIRPYLNGRDGVGVDVMDTFAIVEDRIVSLSSRVTQRDEQNNRLP